jgi:hypothetical protein
LHLLDLQKAFRLLAKSRKKLNRPNHSQHYIPRGFEFGKFRQKEKNEPVDKMCYICILTVSNLDVEKKVVCDVAILRRAKFRRQELKDPFERLKQNSPNYMIISELEEKRLSLNYCGKHSDNLPDAKYTR